jgi:hypothetical protein
MLAPSKAVPNGWLSKKNSVVKFAGYQCRMAICSGFWVDVFTPLSGVNCVGVADMSDKARTPKENETNGLRHDDLLGVQIFS